VNEIASGYFIRLTDEENKDLLEYLREAGFEKPPEGLRQLVLSILYEEDEEPEKKPKPFFQKVAENPELLGQGLSALSKILKRARR
jgi:hypothetical protein